MTEHPNLLLSFIKSRSKVFVYERYHHKSYKNNINWECIFRFKYFYDEEVVCSICYNFPILPRMDKCGHIFCLSCLINLCKHEETQFVLCPVCKNYNINVSESKRVIFEKITNIKIGSKLTFELLVKGYESIYPDYYYNLVSPLPNAPFSNAPNSFFSNISVDKDSEVLKMINDDIRCLNYWNKFIVSLNGKEIERETMQFLFNEIADFKLNIALDEYSSNNIKNQEKSLDCFNFVLDMKQQLERFTLFYQCNAGRFVMLEPSLNTVFLVAKRNPLFPYESKHFKSKIVGKVLSTRIEKVTQKFINQTKFTQLPLGATVTLVTINSSSKKSYPSEILYENVIEHRNAVFKDKKNMDFLRRKSAAKRKMLAKKGIMFTPMIGDEEHLAIKQMSFYTFSEDAIPSSFNLCMLGLDCIDPDEEYPHSKECKYYSVKEWLEEEDWYWIHYGKNELISTIIPQTIDENSPESVLDQYVKEIEESIAESITTQKINNSKEFLIESSAVCQENMIEDVLVQSTSALQINSIDETFPELITAPEIDETPPEPITESKLNKIDEPITNSMATLHIGNIHAREPPIKSSNKVEEIKNYPPENIKNVTLSTQPLQFKVNIITKKTQREDKNKLKEKRKKKNRK